MFEHFACLTTSAKLLFNCSVKSPPCVNDRYVCIPIRIIVDTYLNMKYLCIKIVFIYFKIEKMTQLLKQRLEVAVIIGYNWSAFWKTDSKRTPDCGYTPVFGKIRDKNE